MFAEGIMAAFGAEVQAAGTGVWEAFHGAALLPFESCCCLVAQSCLTLSLPYGLLPARLLCPWDFSGKNT